MKYLVTIAIQYEVEAEDKQIGRMPLSWLTSYFSQTAWERLTRETRLSLSSTELRKWRTDMTEPTLFQGWMNVERLRVIAHEAAEQESEPYWKEFWRKTYSELTAQGKGLRKLMGKKSNQV
jgi:hypothetical protein